MTVLSRLRRALPRIGLAALGASILAGEGATSAAAQTGDLPWMDPQMPAPQRTEMLLDAMTLDQKLQQIYNLPVLNEELQDDGCDFQFVGRHVEGIPELGIPTFRFANGGTGIRGGDCLPEPRATGLPAGVAGAATFDTNINFEWGQVLGTEIRNWAHHSLWGAGPQLDPHPVRRA